jgi:hypothetical protein
MSKRGRRGRLPPVNRIPENLAGTAYYEIEVVRVAEFHEEADGRGPPTQVHLLLKVGGLPHPLVLRFKGPGTIGQLIAMLRRHRANVWPGAPEVDP